MVATMIFFDKSLALWAARKLALVLIDPLLKILAYDLMALDFLAVPLFAALEAKLSFARWTL